MPPPCCVTHGTTKHARHAYSANCRPALQFLAPQLFLFSFILSDDSSMLSHFLRHYQRLGVWPGHTRVAIRARRSANIATTNATLAVLKQAGVPRSNVRIIRSPPSDTLKIQLMNDHLGSLPPTAWSIYADVDELFDYPCEVLKPKIEWIPLRLTQTDSLSLSLSRRRSPSRSCQLEGAVKRNKLCFGGTMWDQLAANGNISELADQPDIALQYPLQCRIRATVVPRVQITKVILHRVYGDSKAENPPKHALVRFRNTHAIAGSNYTSSRCGTRGLVRHYTMTAHQWVGNRQKAAMRIDGPSVAETRNYANATCGNVDKSTGGCLDYELLQRFMDRQVASVRSRSAHGSKRDERPSANAASGSDGIGAEVVAGVSRLCPQTLEQMQAGAPCSSTNVIMCR